MIRDYPLQSLFYPRPILQNPGHRDAWRSATSRRSHRDAPRTARTLIAEPTSSSVVASAVLLNDMAQSINITELNLPQLEMLKNQLDQVGTGTSGSFLAPHSPLPHAYPFARLRSSSGGFLCQARLLLAPAPAQPCPAPGRGAPLLSSLAPALTLFPNSAGSGVLVHVHRPAQGGADQVRGSQGLSERAEQEQRGYGVGAEGSLGRSRRAGFSSCFLTWPSLGTAILSVSSVTSSAFACCLWRVEMYRTFPCSCHLFPFSSHCGLCGLVELPLMSWLGSCQPSPGVYVNCFHRERITRPTDKFCILSTGTTTVLSLTPHSLF